MLPPLTAVSFSTKFHGRFEHFYLPSFQYLHCVGGSLSSAVAREAAVAAEQAHPLPHLPSHRQPVQSAAPSLVPLQPQLGERNPGTEGDRWGAEQEDE